MQNPRNKERVILHVDMNSFFASVEQRDRPELKGKPICVVGSGTRTVITTSSYEARAFGVKTGMNLYEAKGVCPELIVVVGNNKRYAEISSVIMELLGDFSPIVEVASVDEAFLDLTGCFYIYADKEQAGRAIKARILEETGLTCSVGIAPNKLLAKLASDMEKPDGLTIIEPWQVGPVLADLPVGELCGIGRKTVKTLAMMGVRTCSDLAKMPMEFLRLKFGIPGDRLHEMALGIDDAPVVPAQETPPAKSAGHSITFPQDLFSRDQIHCELLNLSEMVSQRVRRYNLAGQTVTITVRYADFTTFTRQTTLDEATARTDLICAAAEELLALAKPNQAIRLLGVRLSKLSSPDQQSLFSDADDKFRALSNTVDRLNKKYGSGAVTLGSLKHSDRGSSVISPSWRPDGIRNVELNPGKKDK